MLRHYAELKAAHPERVLLYQLGDFFECFFEDAIELSRVLELTLPGKEASSDTARRQLPITSTLSGNASGNRQPFQPIGVVAVLGILTDLTRCRDGTARPELWLGLSISPGLLWPFFFGYCVKAEQNLAAQIDAAVGS